MTTKVLAGSSMIVMRFGFFVVVFFVFCVVQGVLAVPVPLEITHAPVKITDGVPDREQTENLARLKIAETDANRHILKMEHVLDNPTVPKNAELIHAAFGKNADMNEVRKTVKTLKTGKLPVSLHTDPDPDLLASVQYDMSNPAKPGDADFGRKFHDPTADRNLRAATLVHEATHTLANTGDKVDLHNKMIPGNDFTTPESLRDGYASTVEPAKTPAELNSDPKWTVMRDGSVHYPPIIDLHNNAESYAQFGSMCDTAISDAAVGLRRRALEERDWATAAIYLIRRHACAMRKKAPEYPVASSNAKISPHAKAGVSELKPNTNAGDTKAGTGKPRISAPMTKPRKSSAVVSDDARGKSRIPVPVPLVSVPSVNAPLTKKAPLAGSGSVKVKSTVSRIPVSWGRSKVEGNANQFTKVQNTSQLSAKAQPERISSKARPVTSKATPKGFTRPAAKALKSLPESAKKVPVGRFSKVHIPPPRSRTKASTKLPIPVSKSVH